MCYTINCEFNLKGDRAMLSEKKKLSNRKWDKENMKTVSCRLKIKDADLFKKYCSEIGLTPAQYLKRHIMDIIEKNYNSED